MLSKKNIARRNVVKDERGNVPTKDEEKIKTRLKKYCERLQMHQKNQTVKQIELKETMNYLPGPDILRSEVEVAVR